MYHRAISRNLITLRASKAGGAANYHNTPLLLAAKLPSPPSTPHPITSPVVPQHASVSAIPKPSSYATDDYSQKWSDDDPGHDVQGAGHGRHTKRTLASLSMDGKVCVVTGAGRGLGNMMARTFVES